MGLFWLRHLGRALVVQWHASLSNGATRKYRVTPPLDDPQLRVDPCGRHSPHVLTCHVVPLALVLPNELHHGVMAMLGPEPSSRRVDGTEAVASFSKLQFLRCWEIALPPTNSG